MLAVQQQPNNNMFRIPNRIFVGGIPQTASQTELRDYFSFFGTVRDARIITDSNGVSKGFGFVTYETEEDAQKALNMDESQLVFKENKLNVGHAYRKNNNQQQQGGGAFGGQQQQHYQQRQPYGQQQQQPQYGQFQQQQQQYGQQPGGYGGPNKFNNRNNFGGQQQQRQPYGQQQQQPYQNRNNSGGGYRGNGNFGGQGGASASAIGQQPGGMVYHQQHGMEM